MDDVDKSFLLEIGWGYRDSFEILKNIYIHNNMFLTKDKKDIYLKEISLALRKLHLVKKCSYIWRQRIVKKIYHNDTSLHLESFEGMSNSDIVYVSDKICDTQHIFRFTCVDMNEIARKTFISSESQVCSFHVIRNPYTNTQFTQNQLWNIFIQMRTNKMKIDWLFDEFRQCNFEYCEFYTKMSSYLAHCAIQDDILGMNEREFRRECETVLHKMIVRKLFCCYLRSTDMYRFDVSCIPIGELRRYFQDIIVFMMGQNTIFVPYEDDELKQKRMQSIREKVTMFYIDNPHILKKNGETRMT